MPAQANQNQRGAAGLASGTLERRFSGGKDDARRSGGDEDVRSAGGKELAR